MKTYYKKHHVKVTDQEVDDTRTCWTCHGKIRSLKFTACSFDSGRSWTAYVQRYGMEIDNHGKDGESLEQVVSDAAEAARCYTRADARAYCETLA